MTSSALTFLRGAPGSQATIYNSYLEKSSQVRADQLSSGPAKLAQIGKLLTPATDELQALLDKVNAAEEAVRKAASASTEDIDQDCVSTVRWAFQHGLALLDVCQQLLDDGDKAGFVALRAQLPWLARMKSLGNQDAHAPLQRVVAHAENTIRGFELQVMTADEQALAAEVQELDGNMGLLRRNFQALSAFFQTQTLATAVSGMFKRLYKLDNWVDFISGSSGFHANPKTVASLLLSDDFGGAYKAAPAPNTQGPALEGNFEPAAHPYLVR